MKLAVLIGLLLFIAANTVQSVPTEFGEGDNDEMKDSYDYEESNVQLLEGYLQERNMQKSFAEKENKEEEMRESTNNPEPDLEEKQNSQQPETSLEEQEEGDPGANFLKEVKDYFKEQNASTQGSVHAISQGDTIALQTFVRDHWLGCAGHLCGRANCPRMMMTGSDWNNCRGEVFQIYRAAGNGQVRVGDLVGLHYPREYGTWLGCPGHLCGKSRCPGHPNKAYGFSKRYNWCRCWGEVFRIVAVGKKIGSLIYPFDDIALQYLRGHLWLAQGFGHTDRRPCLGHSIPPAVSTYDGCPFETFKIWKKGVY